MFSRDTDKLKCLCLNNNIFDTTISRNMYTCKLWSFKSQDGTPMFWLVTVTIGGCLGNTWKSCGSSQKFTKMGNHPPTHPPSLFPSQISLINGMWLWLMENGQSVHQTDLSFAPSYTNMLWLAPLLVGTQQGPVELCGHSDSRHLASSLCRSSQATFRNPLVVNCQSQEPWSHTGTLHPKSAIHKETPAHSHETTKVVIIKQFYGLLLSLKSLTCAEATHPVREW